MAEIVKRGENVTTVRALLERSKAQIQMALPRHMTPDRLMRIAMTSIQRTPSLQECTPLSLVAAVLQSAQLGLEPDGVLGQAYLVPYRNNKKGGVTEAQFQIGYKGLLALARRSGEIASISARAVFEKDAFRYAYGLSEILEHTPSRETDPGHLVYVYAVAKFKNGGHQFEVMSKAQVDAIRAQAKASAQGPWVTHYEEMAKKTALRRLCKYLPASVELAQAVAYDERADAGLPPVVEGIVIDQEPASTHAESVAEAAAQKTNAESAATTKAVKERLATKKAARTEAAVVPASHPPEPEPAAQEESPDEPEPPESNIPEIEEDDLPFDMAGYMPADAEAAAKMKADTIREIESTLDGMGYPADVVPTFAVKLGLSEHPSIADYTQIELNHVLDAIVKERKALAERDRAAEIKQKAAGRSDAIRAEIAQTRETLKGVAAYATDAKWRSAVAASLIPDAFDGNLNACDEAKLTKILSLNRKWQAKVGVGASIT